jgi:putative colanic acid biosynthesis glycosyltransferase
MADPWLTIITVVKDDPAGLHRTKRSLLGLDLDRVEWVVVDSSADPSPVRAAVNEPGLPATYAWTPPSGVYGAMNQALRLANGDYTWFVNAGDEVAPGDTLALLHSALAEGPLWLIGQVAFVDANGQHTVPAPFDYSREREHLFARGRFAPHQGTIVRTSWLRDQGGFAPGYTIAADYEASLRLSMAADPVVIDSVIAVFHVGGLSAQRWRTSVAEFHRARRTVLRPTGVDSLREWALTGTSFVREASAAALRRWRPTT